MNVNITLQCDNCSEATNCRIGLSARYERPLRFSCQDCGSPIDINLKKPVEFMLGQSRPQYVGAKQIETHAPFDSDTNFVDLHQDFPVSFEKYIMGFTPYLRASSRIGPEAMQLHGSRLAYLDGQHTKVRDFNNLLKFYARGKPVPFRTNAKRVFGVDTKSDRPEDTNAALYVLIANVMMPFALPGANKDASTLFFKVIRGAATSHRAALDAFMQELIDTGFLKKLQLDCLEIYPRILAAEIALRPALFLDFDEEYKRDLTPMRVSVDEFDVYKDLYKDLCEIVSRQIVLVAGLNNLMKRGDHNAFLPEIGKTRGGADHTPKSLASFADVDVGRKLEYIDDNWYSFENDGATNQLRNAIAHYKTEYDDVTQIIKYFPKKEGLREEKSKELYFLEFLKRILSMYRELHGLQHLIKGLFYYEYLERKKRAA